MTIPLDDAKNGERTWRVAVIGAGLTGLSAAHRLGEVCQQTGRPLELEVFEASGRAGGAIETERMGDYLVERGPDSFISSKPSAVELCQRLELEDQLIATDDAYRRSLVLRRGRPVPVPEGFLLVSPAKVGPILASPIFSPWGKLRMGLEYLVPRRAADDDESLASFVRRRFGRETLDRLVQALVGGIYTSDPETLSLKATMPRFLEMEREHRSLIRAVRRQAASSLQTSQKDSGARYSMFLTLRGGLSSLIERLVARVEEIGRLRLGTAVSHLRKVESGEPGRNNNAWQVTLDDKTVETYDAVVVALRTYHAAGLLLDCDAGLAESLKNIDYATSVVVLSGHRLADIQHPLNAFGLVIPAIEKRRVLAVSFSSRKFPGRAPEGRVLLRSFVGGAMQPEEAAASDEQIAETVKGELSSLLGVSGDADFTVVSRHNQAMPQYAVGHLDRVADIERQVAKHGGLELAGNAYRGVGIPDSIHSAENAVDRLCAAENQRVTEVL